MSTNCQLGMELYVVVKLSIFDNWERFADIPFRFIARS